MGYEDDALDAAVWFERLSRLLHASRKGGVAERLIRQAYHLQRLAPHAIRPLMSDPICEARMESMLEAGDYAEAVVCLIGSKPQIRMTERAARASGKPDEPEARETPDFSVAMLEGWAEGLLRFRPKPH